MRSDLIWVLSLTFHMYALVTVNHMGPGHKVSHGGVRARLQCFWNYFILVLGC